MVIRPISTVYGWESPLYRATFEIESGIFLIEWGICDLCVTLFWPLSYLTELLS